MQTSDIRPIKELVQSLGCKAVIYGPAGSAKTPIAATATRPLMLITEPGTLSMRNEIIPAYEAYDVKTLNDFFAWFRSSKDVANYDTFCIDSVSQMCEIILTDELKNNRDGRKAYGELSRKTMEIMNGLYYTKQKHLYLIFKEQKFDENGVITKRPFMPGQDLPVKIPHLFDFVLRLAKVNNIPNVIGEQLAFKCIGSYDVLARNRTGNLNEFEPPHFGQLVSKAMSSPPIGY